MTALDYVAIGMLIVMASMAVAVFIFVGGWPGRVAATRGHPYRAAVSIGGWVTLLFGGVFYPVILVWAYAGKTDAEAAVLASDDGKAK